MASTTFRKVLVPVLFEVAESNTPATHRISVPGHLAVQVSDSTAEALRLACELGEEVHLVHATPELTHLSVYAGPEGAWFPLDSAAQVDKVTRERSLDVLREIARRHCGDTPVRYFVEPGRPATVVRDAAEEIAPDAIVLATSGRRALRRALLGSTANKVIRHSPCPVLVVPEPTGPQPDPASF